MLESSQRKHERVCSNILATSARLNIPSQRCFPVTLINNSGLVGEKEERVY